MGGAGALAQDVAVGSKWTELMKAVRGLFTELAAGHQGARVSVIAYDDVAERVFVEQVPSPALADRIEWAGHGTDFGRPLAEAYDIALASQGKYQSLALLLLSDGSAGVPLAEIKAFNAQASLMTKLRFLAVGFGDSQSFSVLEEIARRLKGTFRIAKTGQDLQLRQLIDLKGTSSSGSSSVITHTTVVGPQMGCRPDPCGTRKRLRPDGACEPCPEYHYPTGSVTLPDGRKVARALCEARRCGRRERLTAAGGCESCPAYTRAALDGRSCEPQTCTRR